MGTKSQCYEKQPFINKMEMLFFPLREKIAILGRPYVLMESLYTEYPGKDLLRCTHIFCPGKKNTDNTDETDFFSSEGRENNPCLSHWFPNKGFSRLPVRSGGDLFCFAEIKDPFNPSYPCHPCSLRLVGTR